MEHFLSMSKFIKYRLKILEMKFGIGQICRYPRILMYHMVCPKLPYKYYSDGQKVKNYLRVSPSEFEKQLEWLLKEEFAFYTMEHVLDDTLPEKSIFLTFDDGYGDNYTYAFEILKKYKIPATIYLIANRFTHDWATDMRTGTALQELNDQMMLSHEQVCEMVGSGLIEFGAHTLDHTRLNQLSEDTAWQQISLSREMIMKQYNIPCTSFAYPFGFFDKQNVEMVKKAGFANACTTEDGVNRSRIAARFMLSRIMISGNDSMRKFKRKIMKASVNNEINR